MPNIGAVLREEIRRLARKETKAAVLPLRKLTNALIRRVAQQKRRIRELERVSKLAVKAVGRKTAEVVEKGPRGRFSPKWMRKHRKKLGMSRFHYAKLIGVSAQSVMGWEQGKKRPRQATVDTWSRIRKMGVREAKAMLASAKSPGKRKGRAQARKGVRARVRARRRRR